MATSTVDVGCGATVCARPGVTPIPTGPATSATASGQPIGMNFMRMLLPPHRNQRHGIATRNPDHRPLNDSASRRTRR